MICLHLWPAGHLRPITPKRYDIMTEQLRPVATGLCAYGMSGQVFHAPFLQILPGFSLDAVVERHEKKAAQRYPGVRSYDQVDALLADEALELIIVNTPNITHYDYTKKALLAGKHVIVEKPFTATLEQARELVDLAREKQRLLVVFQNRRWDSDFQAVKAVVDKGVLGRLIEAEFHYDRYTPEPSYKKHKEIPGAGVGIIYDLGPHIIDQAIVLFGRPQKVFALIQTHRPVSKVDDFFDVMLLYPHFTCTLKSSLLVRHPIPSFVVHGTEGSFLKTRSDIQEAELQGGAVPGTPEWGEELEDAWGLLHTGLGPQEKLQYVPSPAGAYQEFYKGVYAALREGAPSPVPLEDSLLNIEIIEAAWRSQREGQVITLG